MAIQTKCEDIDWVNNHVYNEDADFSGNFILVIGKYNTSGNQGDMGQAYHDWVTFQQLNLELPMLVITAIILQGRIRSNGC